MRWGSLALTPTYVATEETHSRIPNPKSQIPPLSRIRRQMHARHGAAGGIRCVGKRGIPGDCGR